MCLTFGNDGNIVVSASKMSCARGRCSGRGCKHARARLRYSSGASTPPSRMIKSAIFPCCAAVSRSCNQCFYFSQNNGHITPKHYTLSLSKKYVFWIKVSKKKMFHSPNRGTAGNATACVCIHHCSRHEVLIFSRNVGYVPPKFIHLYYLTNIFSGSKYPKKKIIIYIWKQKHWKCSVPPNQGREREGWKQKGGARWCLGSKHQLPGWQGRLAPWTDCEYVRVQRRWRNHHARLRHARGWQREWKIVLTSAASAAPALCHPATGVAVTDNILLRSPPNLIIVITKKIMVVESKYPK